jgi:hypothetical protein
VPRQRAQQSLQSSAQEFSSKKQARSTSPRTWVAPVKQTGGGTHGALVTAPSVPAFRQAIHMVRRKGTVVLVGLPPGEFPTPIFDVVLGRITIRGSIVGGRQDLDESDRVRGRREGPFSLPRDEARGHQPSVQRYEGRKTRWPDGDDVFLRPRSIEIGSVAIYFASISASARPTRTGREIPDCELASRIPWLWPASQHRRIWHQGVRRRRAARKSSWRYRCCNRMDGRARRDSHERTQRSLPSQHIALMVSTMIALTALIAVYGVVWKANPRLIAWYAWISPEIPIEGSVDIQEPLKVEIFP